MISCQRPYGLFTTYIIQEELTRNSEAENTWHTHNFKKYCLLRRSYPGNLFLYYSNLHFNMLHFFKYVNNILIDIYNIDFKNEFNKSKYSCPI